jgi:hypothetical protein
MDSISPPPTASRREQIRYVCRQGGAQNGRGWTPEEIEQVRRHYPDTKKLAKLLPDRTLQAVRDRAGQLGLRRKQHRWRACDVTNLKRMWTTGVSKKEIEIALSSYSWEHIKDQARARGFRRPKKELLPTGHAVIDQIRKRARDLNMNMRDIDALAHTGNYFYSAAWLRHKQPNPRHVAKAIAALDGHLEAVWH